MKECNNCGCKAYELITITDASGIKYSLLGKKCIKCGYILLNEINQTFKDNELSQIISDVSDYNLSILIKKRD